MALAPSIAELDRLAEQAFLALPDAVRANCTTLIVRVEEEADEETLAAMEIDNPYELTGLYDGVPLTEKSVADPVPRTDVVWLYRRAILWEWVERGDVTLEELVTHVLVHEIAHHLGWTDDEIAEVDRWWE
jgi:predicted Zn-dependent protease with MMP-like domain